MQQNTLYSRLPQKNTFENVTAQNLCSSLVHDEFSGATSVKTEFGSGIAPTLKVVTPGVVVSHAHPSMHRTFLTSQHAVFASDRILPLLSNQFNRHFLWCWHHLMLFGGADYA